MSEGPISELRKHLILGVYCTRRLATAEQSAAASPSLTAVVLLELAALKKKKI